MGLEVRSFVFKDLPIPQPLASFDGERLGIGDGQMMGVLSN
jgi:hypothetical protein